MFLVRSTIFSLLQYIQQYCSSVVKKKTEKDRTGTINTKHDKWPGKSTLGTIIKKVEKKVRKRKLSDNTSKTQEQNREQAKKWNNVDMLKKLRAASESNASGFNPDFESS